MISPSELTKATKKEAHRLGFQLVGVTTPDPPAHLDVYVQWLDASHHAGMGWMAAERNRQRRADPLQILPECETVLVLGVRYPPPSVPPDFRGETGVVASYAWGDDYHDVLPERLRALVSFIETQAGRPVPNRCYTDTGPILERELAQRAGLGWIGKNTNLINPNIGSYFFLAEILLGIKLEVDAPFAADRCGTCTRCIDACPTNCILPNRTIDSNGCISYLTIELKASIPAELRPKIGDHIFGCDICQQVCPWNQRFARPDAGRLFRPRLEEDNPTLRHDLALSPQEFNRKFAGSPIKRTKRRGYLRNVAVALGNTGSASDIPALARALHDDEPLIRAHAAWALGQIDGDESANALTTAARTEVDEIVLTEIQSALTECYDRR
ncbi:MAG: tRNA epoxyqueuosine(34) reductase QueG [Chloroflexota bacterium]|nr:tRNA epoxyqueuosine(34) reductase QueG [Chloroflexota bacterium]